MSFIKRWFTFLKERHEPISITIMISAFFAANAFIAYQPGVHAPPCWKRLLTGFVLVWLVFLHMRLFDEVKDYEVDKEHNPDRPLARGLISVEEFSAMTLVCIIVEFILAGLMKWPTLPTFMMVLCFTLIMRMEFFIGKWMEPKMELYAITHTFSASMISILIHNIVCFSDPSGADKAFLVFALGNWFVFNVFEFGRKTFAKEEEREGVDTYSKRLNPGGAVLLLMVNIIAAYGCLYYATGLKFAGSFNQIVVPAGIISALVAVSGIIYSFKPNLKFAKLYRGTVALYLLAYPASVAVAIYLTVYR